VLTAQDAQTTDQTKQQASIQTAQNSVDQAQSALDKSNATLQNTVAQQAATLQTSQNSVAQAGSALNTQQATFASSTAGPTQNDLATANAQVSGAQAAVKTAQNNLAGAVLTAPTSGTIASLNGTVGQFISGGATGSSASSSSSTSSTSSAFITLSDLSTPQVSASVSEADIGKVLPGQKVNFTVTAFPGKTFTGTVAAIVPAGTTTSNVVTYTVLISVDPTDVQLLPSMTATVTIVTQEAAGAVIVPNAAISNGKVSVMRNGSPVSVAVQTGISDGVNTQIVSGVQAGDVVVTGVASGKTSSSSSSGTRSILNTGGGAPATRPGG
jgi:multidrug efflux pump subunit AcrA (membrane-fusion protein)